MLKLLSILGSISALASPLLSLSFENNFFKHSKQVKQKTSKHLLYSFNNKIYEDKKEILRDFLLAHPNFIKTQNVLGDLDKAIIDYDQKMLNEDLVSIYNPDYISPVYKKADGEFVKDYQEAQKSSVNPAFIRERLTDGFNNYFSQENGREAAINSYARRIYEGKIGVIKIDNFNSVVPNYYNPLSKEDFQNLKNNTINQIKNNPSTLLRNGYSHKWFNNENHKEIKSFDDIFDGSTTKLKSFIETSFDKYTIMKQIYSPTNGYNENQSLLRDERKIHGKNLNASIVAYSGKSINEKNPSYSLLSSNNLQTRRNQLLNKINAKKQEKQNFINKKDTNNYLSNISIDINNWSNQKTNPKNFSASWEDLNNSEEKNKYSGSDYNAKLIYRLEKLSSRSTWYASKIWDTISTKYSSSFKYEEDMGKTINLSWNLKESFYNNDEIRVSVLSQNTDNGGIDYTWCSPLIKIKSYNGNTNDQSTTNDITNINVDFKIKTNGGHWYDTDDFYRDIKIKNFSIKYNQNYKSNNKKEMFLKAGKIFMNTSEFNSYKNKPNFIYKIFLKELPLKYDSNFLNNPYYRNYTKININNNLFKFYSTPNNNNMISPRIIYQNSKPYLKIGIKYVQNSRIYSNTKYIDIPIEVYEDFDQTISNLTNQFHKINTNNGYNISSVLDYNENTNKYINNSNLLNNNLNNFNSNSKIGANNNKIIMSYNQFKHFIKIYDLQQNKLLATNSNLNSWTNNIYIKASFRNNAIDEIYKVPLEKIIKDGNQQLASLMDGREATNDLEFIIDFSKMILSNNEQEIKNLNFKWSFKENLANGIKAEYQEFQNPSKKPFSINFDKITKGSLEKDNLYMVLDKIKQEISNNSIWKYTDNFTKFLKSLNPQNYNSKFEERLNLNNHLLWKINRNLESDNNNNFRSIDFIAQRNKKYDLKDFLEVLDISDYQKNKMIYAIKNKQYDQLKALLRKSSLVNIKSINPNKKIEFLAWNYFKTLQSFINKSSLIGSLPNRSEYEFPDLSHIFIGNQKVYQMQYLVDSEYRVNGQLIDATKMNSIPLLYKDDVQGNKDLQKIKKQKISSFEPPLVTQLFNADGQQFRQSSKMNYDSEEITILNALWSIKPKILKKHVFYKGKAEPILFQMHLVYYIDIKIKDEYKSYYFIDYDSAKKFINEYIQKFIITIDLDSNKGGYDV